jgi:hypothetical protein
MPVTGVGADIIAAKMLQIPTQIPKPIATVTNFLAYFLY